MIDVAYALPRSLACGNVRNIDYWDSQGRKLYNVIKLVSGCLVTIIIYYFNLRGFSGSRRYWHSGITSGVDIKVLSRGRLGYQAYVYALRRFWGLNIARHHMFHSGDRRDKVVPAERHKYPV